MNRWRGRMEQWDQGRKPQQILGPSLLFVDGLSGERLVV